MNKRQKNQQETIACIHCQQPIHPNAAVCHHCNLPQGKKRFLQSSHLILSLIIAFLGVLTATVPVIQKALKPESSSVSLEFAFSKPDSGYFIVNNTGSRPALLRELRLSFGHQYYATFDWTGLSKNTQELSQKDSAQIYRFSHQQLIGKNPFIFSYVSGEHQESLAAYEFGWQEYFPGFARQDSWQVDWCGIFTSRLQTIVDQGIVQQLDEIDVVYYNDIDQTYPSKSARINTFIDHFTEREIPIPAEHEDAIEHFLEARQLTTHLQNCLTQQPVSLELDIVNSTGQPQTLTSNIPYPAIKDFIAPLLLGQPAMSWKTVDYFFVD